MANNNDFTTDTARWQAVIERNPQAGGAFVYAVQTTGIYCRPGCASRQPNRANVQFLADGPAAEAAGFRPCKRCAPQTVTAPTPSLDAVAQACQIIEESDHEPSLDELAAAVNLSPYHFHRLFKKTVGVTPKQYAAEHRLNKVRSNLQEDTSVTEAIYEAGYEAGSRFYEHAPTTLGMKPSTFKKGGAGQVIRYAVAPSYLGWVLVAVTERGICRIDLADDPAVLPARLQERFPAAHLEADDPTITGIVAETVTFLEAPEQGLALPLDVQGTAFQRRVWAALQNIPAGGTASYAEIAGQIGQPKAARAVAQACAANTLAVAVPCHRVVRSNGELGGYRWGLDRKQTILEREAAQPGG